MRHVLYISGSRADFGPARSVLKAIQAEPDFRLSILVTGMHLDPAHGETWQDIAADGFFIAERVFGRLRGDSLMAMGASLGLHLYGIIQAIERVKPDIILVLGDRGEQLAGAIAGAFLNTVVVHLCGGSLSGSIDDSIRHAISKFAHYHLPAFEEDARRIIQMGEDPTRVCVVGLPGSDIRPDVTLSRSRICTEFGLPLDKPYILVMQHSVTHSQVDAGRQIVETLEATVALGYPALLANPNDDAGGQEILAKLREYAGRYANLRILPPGNRERFASIMAHAGVLVGNSSSGIVEAMSVGLPVVNVGDRQKGREYLGCLLNVGYDRAQIRQAMDTALHDTEYRRKLDNLARSMPILDTRGLVLNCLRNLDLRAATQPKKFFDLRTLGHTDAPETEGGGEGVRNEHCG